jgi:hypothetical protein
VDNDKIKSSGIELNVKLNKRAVLKCPLSGKPQPRITWLKVNLGPIMKVYVVC